MIVTGHSHLRQRAAAILLGATILAGGISSSSRADSTQGANILTTTYTFHIKPQPLSQALKQFSAATKISVVYGPGVVAGKQTPGIDGNISGFESLTRLLLNTGLAFKQTGKTISIVPAEAASANLPNGGQPSAALAAAWKNYTQAVEDARTGMEATWRFQNEPWTRAKAYHTLLEVEALAYNFVISPRLDFPRIQEATGWQVNNYTLGQNGPDSLYGNLYLDGRQTYRITGRYGDVKLVLLEVYSHVMGQPDSKLIGNYDASDFKPNPDGSFTAILSPTKQDGNWIKLDPTSTDNWILIRRWVGDWAKDVGEMHIEMVSKPPPGFYDYDEFDEAAIAKRINSAANLVRYVAKTFNIGLYDMYLAGSGGQKNHMSLLPGTVTSQIGSPTSKYALGLFDLKDDEALIVKVDPVPADAAYWSFELGDPWSRSLDFTNYQTSLNMAQSFIDADGKFYAVISRRDPGIANWLDTTGHQDGTIVFRNYRSKTQTVPDVQKVKFADIWKYLPADTRRVTADERAAALDHRRKGIEKAYGGVF